VMLKVKVKRSLKLRYHTLPSSCFKMAYLLRACVVCSSVGSERIEVARIEVARMRSDAIGLRSTSRSGFRVRQILIRAYLSRPIGSSARFTSKKSILYP
jgi:hypothetical protein